MSEERRAEGSASRAGWYRTRRTVYVLLALFSLVLLASALGLKLWGAAVLCAVVLAFSLLNLREMKARRRSPDREKRDPRYPLQLAMYAFYAVSSAVGCALTVAAGEWALAVGLAALVLYSVHRLRAVRARGRRSSISG